jgi:hypothetical protein
VLNGGQVIVDYLIREKVPYGFGLRLHGNIGFIDALYERSSSITHEYAVRSSGPRGAPRCGNFEPRGGGPLTEFRPADPAGHCHPETGFYRETFGASRR